MLRSKLVNTKQTPYFSFFCFVLFCAFLALIYFFKNQKEDQQVGRSGCVRGVVGDKRI